MRLVRSASITELMIAFLFLATMAMAQDAPPPRFEVGGNLMAIRGSAPSLGTGVEGAMNFGRHLSLDGAFDYLPATGFQTLAGFFGAKAGIRRQRFGIFGKVRPGFFSSSHVLRSAIINVATGQLTNRFARQTQRALDLGGVVEFYPATHWLLRWDLGDTLFFHERGPVFTVVGLPAIPSPPFPATVTNDVQFSTGFHYRF